MAISPSLQQFKSSGVYRLEFDKSQIINIPSETIRLIIGFSKKGPFNTPVFVQDAVFFKTVFGEIDTALERKGSFFHRTVLTCLDRGPVIVLNLLILNDTNTSQFQTISTSAYMDNGPTTDAPLSSYFNTDKFWFLDPVTFVDYTENNVSVSNQRILNLANVGKKTISVLTKKSDILGFNVLAKDWFGVGKVPEFMKENDYVNDFMIDLIVVEGDFSNYNDLSIDPIFGNYFTPTGLKKTYIDNFGFERDGLTGFLNLDQVNVLGVYSGTLVPEFSDKNGNNLFIQDLVNLETSKTGLLLGFNSERLDDDPFQMSGDELDLVGHTLESEQPAVVDFLSYYGTIVSQIDYAAATAGLSSFVMGGTAGQTANARGFASTGITGATAWTAGRYDTLRIFGPSYSFAGGEYSAFASQTAYQSYIDAISNSNNAFVEVAFGGTGATTGGINYSHVTAVSQNTTSHYTDLLVSKVVGTGVVGPTTISQSYLYINGTGVTAGGTVGVGVISDINFTFGAGATRSIYAGINSPIYQANLSGLITDGDGIGLFGTTASSPPSYGFAEFSRVSTNNFAGSDFTPVFASEAPILSKLTNYITVEAFEESDFTGATAIGSTVGNVGGDPFFIRTYTGDINESFQLWGGTSYSNPTTTVWVDNSSSGPLGASGFNNQVQVGQYLIMNFGGTDTPTNIDPNTGKTRLTKIIAVAEDRNPLSSTYQKIKITTNDPIYIRTDSGVSEIERYKTIDNFVSYYRFHTLSGYELTAAQQPDGTLTRQNEILDVLYNTGLANALTDREVITFRYIVDTFEGGIEPASKIRLTKLAKNQQSSLAICNLPSVKQFRDSTNPMFKYDTGFSFEAKYIAEGGNLAKNPSNVFSLPGIADGANYSAFYGPNLVYREAGRNLSLPPAAHISNLYIDKYTLALPYSIVAGPRRGVVTGAGLVGVEYAFDRVDLDAIEPFGYNAILNKRGFGLVINANQTAQQAVKSALSQIHVRELLIFVQDGIEAILKNYRWEFNTAQNRLEIKTLADNFMTQILSDGGVYDFQNIMDTTNNTVEIIDNNIGILDTYLEPVRGMGILVHRTTILRTGAIATGNFI
jgi:hypothetical protein